MAVHDVRSDLTDPVSVVRFADVTEVQGFNQADTIFIERSAKLTNGECEGEVRIIESGNGDYIRINGVEHARNLIKALDYLITEGVLQ